VQGQWRGIRHVFFYGGRSYNGLDYRRSLLALNAVMQQVCVTRGPVDTLSWLEEKAQDGLCDALTPEHRCESAFSHTESLHDELKTRKRELATICNKLKKIGFVGGWSGIDDRIMDIAKAAMENKTTPTMLEGLDAKLSAKLEPLHHRPSARASSLAIGGTAEETY
jgi:hypothetical protein